MVDDHYICYNCGHGVINHTVIRCCPKSRWEIACIGGTHCDCKQFRHQTVRKKI